MGAVFSCFHDGESEENDALLAGHQNGYGEGSEDFNARQRQMRLHEEQMQARDESLKEIVSNTNDKLIDISMISNSGIVIQGTDLEDCQRDGDNLQPKQPQPDSEEPAVDVAGNQKPKYIILDTKDHLSAEMKHQLRNLHNTIFNSLEEQLREAAPNNLVVNLTK